MPGLFLSISHIQPHVTHSESDEAGVGSFTGEKTNANRS
jgi:hypothetical protein